MCVCVGGGGGVESEVEREMKEVELGRRSLPFRPVHTKPAIFENGDFFLLIRLLFTLFGHRKRRFSKMSSKKEVFKHDDVMPRFKDRSSARTIRKR